MPAWEEFAAEEGTECAKVSGLTRGIFGSGPIVEEGILWPGSCAEGMRAVLPSMTGIPPAAVALEEPGTGCDSGLTRK